jgi:hypothetical protein
VFFSARLQPAYAQTIDWTGNSDGETYQIAENWYGMNIPDTSGENARFNVGADFDVTFESGSSTTVNDLLVNDGVVTFTTAAASTADAAYMIDNQAIIDGSTVSESPHLQLGASVMAEIGEDVFVGVAHRGELTVTGGGLVNGVGSIGGFGVIGSDPNSTGMVTVDGADETGIPSRGRDSALLSYAGDTLLGKKRLVPRVRRRNCPLDRTAC